MNPLVVAFYRDAVLQTIGIACASFVLALLTGAPLALVAARRDALGRSVSGIATAVRAVPELVLAVVAVVAIGLGPVAAIAALALHYAAVVIKLLGDLLGAVRQDAARVLTATGATPAAAFLVGVVPAAWPALVGAAAYTFESVVRASVIVGVVGAGGIGALLVQQLNLADYRGFGVSLAVLAGLVIAVDALAGRLRGRLGARGVALTLVAVAFAGIATLAYTDDPPWRLVPQIPAHLGNFIARALPPDVSGGVLETALGGAAVSIGVALAGTLAGALLALPLAVCVATPLARGWMRGTGWRPWSRGAEVPSRIALAVTRAIPPLALALVALAFVGIGPQAGIVALALHTAGVLGKLLAESFEATELGPAEGLVAAGATAGAATLIALVPSALGGLATHTLYRLEWNTRASTVLGMVGAGGLGGAIFNAQQLLFERQLASYVIAAIVLVLAVDAVTARIRARIRRAFVTF